MTDRIYSIEELYFIKKYDYYFNLDVDLMKTIYIKYHADDSILPHEKRFKAVLEFEKELINRKDYNNLYDIKLIEGNNNA